jgi:hypothetical protein
MIDLDAPIARWLPTAWYPGYLEDLPDLCVGRWPPIFNRTGDDAWKVWIVETPGERKALLNALARPVPRVDAGLDFRSGPDAAVSKPSTGAPFVALYPPPEPEWPAIVLCRWPVEIGRSIASARGRYTYETRHDEDAAIARVSEIAARLGADLPVRLPGGVRH